MFPGKVYGILGGQIAAGDAWSTAGSFAQQQSQ